MAGGGKRISAFAEWRHGRGLTYCQNCTAQDTDCSKGLPGMNGDYCPFVENAARSGEESIVQDICGDAGVWKRVGMDGVVTGISFSEAMERAPIGVLADPAMRERLTTLLREYENGALRGIASMRTKNPSETDPGDDAGNSLEG